VKATERAIRAELRSLDVSPASSLAAVLVNLAKRLDAEPGDRAATMLIREMRLLMVEVWAQTKDDTNHDLERFLESINNPAFRGPGD
jgi:uncharacterized protein (DUF2267 family)